MKWLQLNKPVWQWALLLFLAFIWGSSFILMKRSLEVYSSVQVAALRMTIAGFILMPFALKNLKLLSKNFFPFLIVGFIGNAIPAFLFTFAQLKINSSMAGILNSLTPLFTLLVGVFFFKTKIKYLQAIGIFIAFMGSVLLFYTKDLHFEISMLASGSLIVLATFMYGVNINHVKKNLSHVSGLTVAAMAFLTVLPFTLSVLFFTSFKEVYVNPNFYSATFSVFVLGIFGSAIAVALINILIKHTSAVFASSVTYIMPLFAVLWGISDNEAITITSYLGMGCILIGVYLVQQRKKKNII